MDGGTDGEGGGGEFERGEAFAEEEESAEGGGEGEEHLEGGALGDGEVAVGEGHGAVEKPGAMRGSAGRKREGRTSGGAIRAAPPGTECQTIKPEGGAATE